MYVNESLGLLSCLGGVELLLDKKMRIKELN